MHSGGVSYDPWYWRGSTVWAKKLAFPADALLLWPVSSIYQSDDQSHDLTNRVPNSGSHSYLKSEHLAIWRRILI